MSPAEVASRVLRLVQARAEHRGWIGARSVPAPELAARGNPWIFPDGKLDSKKYVAAADRVVEGRVDVFTLREAQLGLPPRWNRDPKTGIEAPLTFGKALDYRDADLVGDIKYLWEPNRHAHLVTLAQAYALTRRRVYLETIIEHLDSWFLACPYGYGPNWASSLEAALRLINWAAVWQLVGREVLDENSDFRDRWLKSVYQHAEFIRGWLSLHSSANNHLIGEAAGLFVAGLAWPHWRAARGWAATGKLILEREALGSPTQTTFSTIAWVRYVSHRSAPFDAHAMRPRGAGPWSGSLGAARSSTSGLDRGVASDGAGEERRQKSSS
jgi:hypothetical protein